MSFKRMSAFARIISHFKERSFHITPFIYERYCIIKHVNNTTTNVSEYPVSVSHHDYDEQDALYSVASYGGGGCHHVALLRYGTSRSLMLT